MSDMDWKGFSLKGGNFTPLKGWRMPSPVPANILWSFKTSSTLSRAAARHRCKGASPVNSPLSKTFGPGGAAAKTFDTGAALAKTLDAGGAETGSKASRSDPSGGEAQGPHSCVNCRSFDCKALWGVSKDASASRLSGRDAEAKQPAIPATVAKGTPAATEPAT